jgi:hypothetical protein
MASEIRNGGRIQLWECNGQIQQRWYQTGDVGEIRNGAAGQRFCLDARASELRNGGRIQLWECNGLIVQRWVAGLAWFRNTGDAIPITLDFPDNFCVDAMGSEIRDGGRIHLWHYEGRDQQQWFVEDPADV